MTVMLDLNWRIWHDNADQVGWPGPQASAGAKTAWLAANTKPGAADCYQRAAADAALYRSVGFGAVGFPPSTKGAAGNFSGGYDLLDPYDIGSKNQPFTVPTGFGTGAELRRAISAVHAQGMHAYGDLVLHQYDGFNPAKPFAAIGADGVTRNGRFPKVPANFVGAPPLFGPVDAVPDTTGNFGFGSMPRYTGAQNVLAETIAAVQWLQATTGFDGYRVDDVKGTNAAAVHAILTSPGLKGVDAFGEYFDGNPIAVSRWIDELMQRRAGALDFAFKFNTGGICDSGSSAWMGQLADIGYCNVDPFMAWTFCESADTDNSPGEQTINNKALQYAFLLTFPGRPRVYYRDWSSDPGCYGLGKTCIDNLIYIHENFANGAFLPRINNEAHVFAHERTGLDGAPGCVAIFNNDMYNRATRTIQTTMAPGTRLHEYTGKYDTDVWVQPDRSITVTVAENNNGMGFLVFAEWVPPAGFSIRPIRTTQQFIGAADLDTPAAVTGVNVAGTIWPKVGSTITVSLHYDQTLGINQTDLVLQILDPTGRAVPAEQPVALAGPHKLVIIGTSIPAGGIGYTVTATYMGA